MRKYIILALGMLMATIAFSQSVQTWTEDFENSVSFIATPASSWVVNTNYYALDALSLNSKSYLGMVSTYPGDSSILQTPIYDCTNYEYVLLKFSHICKVSSLDIVRIDYRINMGALMGSWKSIPAEVYLGSASNFLIDGFSAASYSEWQAGDNTVFPVQSWWKEEVFDLSGVTAGRALVQFRFIIKHGQEQGTQLSYGWLLDNVEILAGIHDLLLPTIEFRGYYPKDTVYSTGHFVVNALVKTSTAARIQKPLLVYTTTLNGVSKTDSSLMTHVVGDSLWRDTLPQFPEGTSVSYSIIGKDTLDNYTTITASYYVKKLHGDIVQYAYFSPKDTAATTENVGVIFQTDRTDSWSRSLYLNDEIMGDRVPGQDLAITKIAWYNRSYNNNYARKIKVYLQETNQTTISQVYLAPADEEATLVFDGVMTTRLYWNEVTFDVPFFLRSEQNLLIYFEDVTGVAELRMLWATTSITNRCVFFYNVIESQPGPVMRVALVNLGDYAHSAGLSTINSPIGGQTAGISTPITVTLHNKGDSALKNINICWTVNGGAINTHPWTGNLLWDYKDVVTIGNYVPSLEQYDILKIWVSMPNGAVDSSNYDDTLSIITYGCLPGGMRGTYTVGPTGDFHTIKDALNVLELCTPLSGNVTFELESGIYTQGISLRDLSPILGTNTLTITSKMHQAEDVIIKPDVSTGITLHNCSNIIIKDITVDARVAAANAIQFTSSCNNITIRDCRLLTDTTTTAMTTNPIYLNQVGVFDRIFIINNLIEGGYYGIIFGGGARLSTNNIIDSNTFRCQCYYGMLLDNSFHCLSISHNTIISRVFNNITGWYGIYSSASYVENIIGNRIRQRTTGITNPFAIFIQLQQNCPIKGIYTIADNEIIVSTTGAYHGIYLHSGSQANIIHNSIYVEGGGAGRGITIVNAITNLITVKNNNIIMKSPSAHPIYLDAVANMQLYDFDYNNMWGSQYVGYAGGNMTSIAAWQQAVKTDKHSVKIYPGFVDSTSHLQLLDYSELKCLKSSWSAFDIDYRFRIAEGDTTTMGCYHRISPLSVNATLTELKGNREGVVLGNTDNITINLLNTGANPITQATIKWEFNGLSQPDASWTGNLSAEDNISISLGPITYSSAGVYHIKAWIDNLGGSTDEYPFDDTVMFSGSVCLSPMNGVYVLGNNGADFATIQEFIDYLSLCGISGDVTLEIQPGTYEGSLNLSIFSRILEGYRFTMTSTTGNAEDVILKTTSAGIIMGVNRNITIKNITIDVTKGTYAIQFTGACTNIVVRDCRLLASTKVTTTVNGPVFKASGTGIVDSIFFIHNEMDGGYYGFFFYGGTGSGVNQYGTNIVFDSNTLSNQYYYGVYVYYGTFISCGYNTILSRYFLSYTTWMGIYLYYANGPVIGNRIIQRNSAIASSCGIYLMYYNYAPTGQVSGIELVANNEISLSMTAANYAIYTSAAKAAIIHNSIYISGTGAARGIHIQNVAGNNMVIKNNNITLTSPTAYPVYFSAVGNLILYDMDYNNYSASQYIGYYGANITSLADWRAIFLSDIHSVQVLSDYINPSENLQLTNYGSLLCNRTSFVTNDKVRNSRASLTTMGCYEGLSLQNVNAMLARITGVREGMVLLQTDTVSVVIYNTGYTALTSVNLEWSINGISQNTGGTNYPVSLVSRGDFTTISIGQITYPAGNVDIKVWINNINGNAIMDEYANDDTVNKSIYICDGGINGLITIGSSIGSDFKTIKEFQSALSLCGVSGDINLVLEPGIYRENLDLSNNTVLMGNSTLTITSSTDNANDVIIRPVAGWGVLLAYSKNIVLKALTIDAATNGTNAIEFTGTCTNIVVRDCRLLADTTAITNSFNAVSKQQNTGFVENISFIHNLLDGGYYGFVFYGGTGTGTGGYGTNVVFDSNTVSNQYLYSIYLSFIDSLSCSYNTILSRTENINVTWYGIYMNNNNGNVIANRIKQRSDAITNPYGIYVQSHNYYPIEKVQGKGLVANNEIILNTTGAFYGIYANTYTKAKIIHNSIYISGAGIARGIQIMNSAYNDMVIKNNNIFMKDTAAIPIYFSATGNLSVYTIDYNNYYAPNYIGFYGENKTSLTDWRTSINNADLHSVRILPDFINPSINLDLATYDNSLLCPKAEIRTDIDGLIRDNTTTMGAYMDIPAGRDLMLTAVSSWNSEAIINQTVSVYVDVLNAAAIPITGATFGWSVNGVSKTPVPWTTSQALNLMEKRNVSIGTFRVTNTDTFNIKVWVETVNGQPETATWNDTVSAQSVMLPLVEFIVPETDTLGTLSFDVLAKIRSFTGAPTTPPILYMEATHKDAYFFYDSIPMIQNGDIWQATIPQQYYGSKVIYSLTVSDAIGNTMDLRDSVSIAMYFNKISDYIYYASADTSGGVSNTASVLSGTRLNSWSRHLYLNSELENINPLMETYIASIAFKLNVAITTAGVDRTDVRIYMAATTSTMQPATYLDPVINGATLVYQGPMIMQYPGWIELAFSKSFTLPVGSNLMVYIEDYTPITGSFTWKAKTATVGSVSGYPIGTYDAIPTKPVTRFGLGIVDPYKGNNLGLLSLLSPVNDMDNLCGSDYSPVNVTMINLGENDYDFSKDSITLKLEVLYPQNTLYTVSLTLDSGIFESGAINILELEASLPIMYAGRYELKAWVESAIDNIFYDDTIYYTYISGRIGLPIDEDFSNGILSTDFITTPIVGSEAWTSNNNSTLPVQAINGTGILQYTGSRGNMTELTTRQIDLSGSVNPKLEFWYYHDATASDLDNSYTEVNIVADGVHNLALFLYRKGATTGWVKYTVPLNQYTFAQCVLVQFVSMNKYDEHSAQYIDRIIITSEPDLAVSEIIISPEISVCDLKNKTMSVVLRTVTNQTIDLSNYTTNLSVEIPGHSTYTVPLQQIIAGNTSDTVLVTQNMNIDTGNYNIKAYLIPPVDNNPANDNMSYAVDIRPGLSVTVSSLTGGINCFKIGSQVQQEVRIQNTGNVDLPGIEFLLRIRGNSTDTIIKEIGSLDLPAGKDTSYIFTSTYTVPAEATYQVQVTAWMGCDSVLVNSSHAAEECADIHDLSIVSLDSPPTGQTDVAGSMQTISVTVENTDDHYPFTDVVIIASIENEQGQTLINRMGTIPTVDPSSTLPFTFTEPYIVPNDSVYYIKIYLSNQDIYPEDDTLTIKRYTETVGISSIGENNAFTLGQNIPNPAKNSTRIDYSIPESGEVIFHVHSISGQLLYSKMIEAASGKQSFELNTNTLAAGIYFYSIEYKGQRLVKRMSVQK